MSSVLVPAARWERWLDNFRSRHGATRLEVADGALAGRADDGSQFVARLPFELPYVGDPDDTDGFAAAAVPPADWGVLLVRKGGFAMARLSGTTTGESKRGSATSRAGPRPVVSRSSASRGVATTRPGRRTRPRPAMRRGSWAGPRSRS